MARILKRLRDLFASYGLAAVLFLLLLLLTYLGTLYQVEHGLYEAQRRYFQSFFLVHWVRGALPIPLPGGSLLLIVLFINLAWGGISRARKGWSHLGILTAHGGILFLLVGSFITHEFSLTGHLTLREGEDSSWFESDHAWEIAVAGSGQGGPVTEYLIQEADFADLADDRSRQFHFAALPFDLTVSGYAGNSAPRPAQPAQGVQARIVDGFRLETLAPERDGEQNVPGAYVTVTDNATRDTQEGIVWGASRLPLAMTVQGKAWTIDLRRRRWELPFAIQLNRFTRELYPNTGIPKVFASDVTRLEDGASQDIRISMNEPLRYLGYTFFQSSWDPPDAASNGKFSSTLSVVKNPADQYPLYACIITTFGLALHFSTKLVRYFRAQAKESR